MPTGGASRSYDVQGILVLIAWVSTGKAETRIITSSLSNYSIIQVSSRRRMMWHAHASHCCP